MTLKSLKVYFTILLLNGLYAADLYGQNNAPSIYQYFDKAIGTKNLAFNNGTIHSNPYRSVDKTHRYYGTGNYVLGTIVYDGQSYSGVYLKYDLLADRPVVKLDGENNTMGFNMIPEKTASFQIGIVTFKNLDSDATHPKEIKGFYEESIIGTDLILYTKHLKDRIEVLRNDGVFNTYIDKYQFIIKYKDGWHIVNSQKDIAGIFPDLTANISEYYRVNAGIEKSDPNQFTKNLMKQIDNFLMNPTH